MRAILIDPEKRMFTPVEVGDGYKEVQRVL
jgi:hypothetical protein